MKELIFSNVRAQFVTENVIRFECTLDGDFCDKNTLYVPSRDFSLYDTDYAVNVTEKYIEISYSGYVFKLPKRGKTLDGLKVFDANGKVVYTYKRFKNRGELPTPEQTPKIFAVYDNPRVILPPQGYSYVDEVPDSGYVIQENVDDVYLILSNGDHRLLRKLYVDITGRSELVRLSTLGFWDSKYFVYDENSAKARILDYESHGVPLDNMVIDTDWRNAENGMGYDVNEKLFPDIKRVFDFADEHNVEITFNDHPEPFVGAESVLNPKEVRYREENLQRLLSLGLDNWWYDRNWRTILKSPVDGVTPETWGMYIFSEITKHYYQKRDGKRHLRPDMMSNVDNIGNGSYAGAYGNCQNERQIISNTASHRYSIQWTGDIGSDYESLGREVGNVLGGGNNCIPYVNPDCGGHTGNPDRETFIRWMQFGAFAPVFRPHCSDAVKRTREPWAYDDETFLVVREYVKMRYRLLPVLYKEAYESYLYGSPVCRALAYNYPNDKKAVKLKDEYTIGNDILVAPIADYRQAKALPERFYKAPVKATFFDGMEWRGEPICQTEYKCINHYWHLEKPHANVPVFNFSDRMETVIRFEKDSALFVETDDGVVIYVDGEKVFEDLTLHGVTRFFVANLKGNRDYSIKIEHFQGGGDAAVALLYNDDLATFNPCARSVYLPKGMWMDAFDGKVYQGEKTVKKAYALEKTPVFIRMGAILPLLKNGGNAKTTLWNKLVYDFYPSKSESTSGYLYEDDFKTVAYKDGEYRKSAYRSVFDDFEGAFIINLDGAEGKYSGDKKFTTREILLKIHLAEIKTVSRITVNGEEVKFKKHRRNKSVMPFSDGNNAPDGTVVTTKIKTKLTKSVEVKIYI